MIAAAPLVSAALSMLAPSQSTASAGSAAQSAAAAGSDFSQVMSQVSSDAVQSLKTAETLSVDGLQGKAGAQSVVQAVMSAQEALQTALAVRDKSVAAFQEITRMSI